MIPMQRLIKIIVERFVKNPFVWILVVLLFATEYGSYQRWRELTRICDLLGPHDVSVAHPTTAPEEIDNICISQKVDAF
jgi:hypothetical protein